MNAFETTCARSYEAGLYKAASEREELKDVESDNVKHSVLVLNDLPDYLLDVGEQGSGD